VRSLILVVSYAATEPLARAIAAVDHPTHDFVAMTVPEDAAAAAELARHRAREIDAEAILALGTVTTPAIRIESIAKNRIGDPAHRRVVVEGAPDALRTPLDLGAIARSFDANGIAWEASDDAGTDTDNELYFRLLDAHARGSAPPVGMIQLPPGGNETPRLAEGLAEGTVHALLALPPYRLPPA
jgi:pyrrolidone-carboxylate peptidase